MKHKKTKKLSINKLTVASLNGGDMVNMKGGASYGQPSCDTCQSLHVTCERSCTNDLTICSWQICP
jgi:hypothetical protein